MLNKRMLKKLGAKKYAEYCQRKLAHLEQEAKRVQRQIKKTKAEIMKIQDYELKTKAQFPAR